MTRFRGVMPPIPTPFKKDYSLNEVALRTLVEHLIVEGVHAIIPAGSTGEFARLSTEERKRVLEVCIDQARGRIPVIAGTAAPGTREVIELSSHAQEAGAAGLQIVAPFYGRPSEDELFEHYSRVAGSVNIPILVYNNPGTSGIDMRPQFIARLARLPNVVGVKEASGDSRRVRQIIGLVGDKLAVYAGTDDNCLEAFALGARGWVAGVANLIPKLCVKLYELAVGQGDFKAASRLYYEMAELCDKIETATFVQNIKAGLELLGLEAGPPRLPLLPAGEAQRRELGLLLKGMEATPVRPLRSGASAAADGLT